MTNDSQFVIRRATLNDFYIIRDLNEQLFLTEHNSGHDDARLLSWPRSKKGEEYYRKALTDPKKSVFLAKIVGKAIGYLIASSYKKHSYRSVYTGELENMFIVPARRRTGVGLALVGAMKQWLRDLGVVRVYVSAFAKNERAIHFYEAMGFDLWEVGLEMKL